MNRLSKLVFFVAAICFSTMAMAKAITFTAVDAGADHTCALTSAGGVMCWGDNAYGELGNGTTIDSAIPVNVTGLNSGAIAIAVGDHHTCALMNAGGVMCWGANYFGELGNGRIDYYLTIPVNVTGLSSGVVAIVAGYDYSCALMDTGSVMCWGDNTDGKLGDGTTTNSTIPVSVIGLGGRVKAITAGYSHTCALTEAGGAICWGGNAVGELGNGTNTNRFIPVNVTGLGSGVKAIAAGDSHTCAVTTAGGMKCWGSNLKGQLGDGTTADSSTPVNVAGLGGGVMAIAAGDNHTCALMNTGNLKCWGNNLSGQLGNADLAYANIPAMVMGLGGGTTAIAAGWLDTCALNNAGAVKCWGLLLSGNDSFNDSSTPVDVTSLGIGVKAIAVGHSNTCALTNRSGVMCWGFGDEGQLGDGTTTNSATPVNVIGLGIGVKAIAVGGEHTCALTNTDGVMCWGANFDGQLGNGTTNNNANPTPISVTGLNGGVTAITAGFGHTCALMNTSAVMCWGNNDNGQLGDGTTTDSATPVNVIGLGIGVKAIAAGGEHTCALMNTDGVMCWGELGLGTSTDTFTPVSVTGLDSAVTAMAAGDNHTCVLMNTGGVKCWGYNAYGQLGDGTTTYSDVPVDVTGLSSGATAIAAGELHTCALMNTGSMKCWGANYYGELGNGKMSYVTTPVSVHGLGSSTLHDFDGDGKSDVLFVNTSTSGSNYWKDANSSRLYYTGTYNPGYVYLGTGDFDGDGKADILFVNPANNGIAIWRGGLRSAVTFSGTITAGFDNVVIGDFDGDGRDDIFWDNPSTGATSIWWAAVKASATYPGVHSTAYTIAAAADFDGDGMADVFWHKSTTGANIIWLSGNKSTVIYPGASSDLTWAPVGAGDVDGDGKSDLVWYKASNNNTMVWKGGLKSAISYPGTGTSGFTPKAIGDYNGDGNADLFWANDSTLATQIWPGVVKSAVTYPGTYPAGFAVQK
jgi:alpha-tubulin suppressor-like RCC1 family protein